MKTSHIQITFFLTMVVIVLFFWIFWLSAEKVFTQAKSPNSDLIELI
jgi:hypothetical protein